MAWTLTSLKRYHEVGEEFQIHIVQEVSDETLASFMNVIQRAVKEENAQTFINQAEKLNNYYVCQKADGVHFVDRKRVLMMEFMQ
jgi:hypothetical protein